MLGLVAWEDLAGGDLAAALGCSRAAARVRLLRARRRLTAALSTGPCAPTAARALPVSTVDGGTR